MIAGNVKPVEFHENPLLTKDGEERLIAFHNTVIKDQNGKIVGALSSAEDITEHKKAENRFLRYQKQLQLLASKLSVTEEHHLKIFSMQQ